MVAEINLEGSSRHMTEGAAPVPHRSCYCLALTDGNNRPENAGVMVAAASAGDTNAALHPPAVVRQPGITFDLSDVAKAFKGTPCIADLKPTGRFVAKNLFEACGVPMPTKTLLDNGFVHGDCMAVSEYRMAENLKCVWPGILAVCGSLGGLRRAGAVNAPRSSLEVQVSDAEFEKRRAAWQPRGRR